MSQSHSRSHLGTGSARSFFRVQLPKLQLRTPGRRARGGRVLPEKVSHRRARRRVLRVGNTAGVVDCSDIQCKLCVTGDRMGAAATAATRVATRGATHE